MRNPRGGGRRLPSTLPRWSTVLLLGLIITALMGPLGAEDTIEDLESRRVEVREQAAKNASEIDLLLAEDEAVAEALAELESWIALVEADIDSAEQAIVVAEDQARMAQSEVESLDAELEALESLLADRAVEAYVNPGTSSTEAILNADDLNDAARRRFLIAVTQHDITEIVDDIRVARSDRDAQLAVAEQARETADAQRLQLEDRLSELEEARQAHEQVRAELDSRISRYRAETAELEAADDQLSALIRQAQAPPPVVTPAPAEAEPEPTLTPTPTSEATAEPTEVPADTSQGNGSAQLQWPISGPVVSEFGMRVHPIFGDTRMHTGIDIDADTGDPIGAAAAGTVIFAGWQEGYGNVVIVDHGGDLSTVYAHMSALGTSEGAVVSAGQTVGQVGSTGYSTGPHLHFEVRIDGNAVDPLAYLP